MQAGRARDLPPGLSRLTQRRQGGAAGSRRRRAIALTLLVAALGACSKPQPAAQPSPESATPAPAPAIVAAPSATPQVPQGDDPASFRPLASAEVKDAIYRALHSGETQRWQDGKLSGYAVPSLTTGANGCRAVRYTVDQRPGATYESINACDATPGR